MAYSSSLSDEEWEVIKPLLPKKKRTCPPKWSKRQIWDGIFYQLKNGCNWSDLPKDLPPYSTVYWHYKNWKKEGIFEMVMCELHKQLREKVKKKSTWTRLIIIDSQAVQNTCSAGVESKGFCRYKLTNGIKRHLAVDSLGFPFFTCCTKASVSDDRGLIMMLSENIDYFRAKPMNVHKITILVDSGYHPDFIMRELEKVYPQIGKKIRMEKSGKISSEQKKIRRKKRICGSQSKMDH